MQQTTTYKLNLIETDDVFSPEPLNQNAQKVETALAASAQALADEAAARQNADNAEAAARQSADAAETAARKKAVADEAAARQNADAAETAARKKAVADEAAARQSAIAAEAAARQSAVAALSSHKFACGTYTGSGTNPQTIHLSFTPRAVVVPVSSSNGLATVVCLAERSCGVVEIVSGGFSVKSISSSKDYQNANALNTVYPYLAFA